MKQNKTSRKVPIKLDGKDMLVEVIGGIHAIPTTAEQPTTEMTQWQVVLVTDDSAVRTRHLVGWANWEGRVSSAVKRWDWSNRTATTGSGRVYRLVGESGFDRDADYVFSRWLAINRARVASLSTAAVERLFAKHAKHVTADEAEIPTPVKKSRRARHGR